MPRKKAAYSLSILLPLEKEVHVVDQVGARVVLAQALHHQSRSCLQIAAGQGMVLIPIFTCGFAQTMISGPA